MDPNPTFQLVISNREVIGPSVPASLISLAETASRQCHDRGPVFPRVLFDPMPWIFSQASERALLCPVSCTDNFGTPTRRLQNYVCQGTVSS